VGVDDREALLERALRAARAGAALAAERRAGGVGEVRTKTTETDVVTSADRAVEALVRAQLLDGHPEDRVLGEEEGEGDHPTDPAAPACGVRWIVDPIDGTVNYVYGIPHYAVSIAAEVAGVVVAGVVVNVGTGEEWTAVLGGGAWRNGVRLSGPAMVDDLGRALIATGFAYDALRRRHQGAVVAALLPRVRDIRRFGAAALDLCAVAEGRVDGYFEKGLALWDRAAGELVAAEAGVLVTGLRGAPSGPEMVLAAPAPVYKQLRDLLEEFDADGGP